MSETIEPKNKIFGLPEKKPRIFWAVSVAIAILVFLAGSFIVEKATSGQVKGAFSFLSALSKSKKKKAFEDKFNKKNRKIEEAGKISESSDSNWWVNSGGWLEISGGTGKTIQGELSSDNKWYKSYNNNNPEDTDDGIHPQNIFRLVLAKKRQNFQQQVFFRINKINLSESENRNESNGVLLFNRYLDSDDLYYTGIRVDGYAVIKKKIDGDYHTLAYDRVFDGDYDQDSSPNLLPVGKWLGIRSVVETKKNGDVEISLFYKKGRNTKKWKLVSHYVDHGQKGDIISDPGYSGIRSDFMDVEFDKYKITER